jgi:hypothetical protein
MKPCPFCHDTHAATYRCNAQHIALANSVANYERSVAKELANTVTNIANADKKLRDDAACYMRYRDPAARRAYMKAYMAKRRAK